MITTSSQKRTIVLMPTPNQSYLIIGKNITRRGLFLYNQSGNTVYVTFGEVSNASSPTFVISAWSGWSMVGEVVWTGPISAIRNAGSGATLAMVVTEIM
jgi:hypothetical protein